MISLVAELRVYLLLSCMKKGAYSASTNTNKPGTIQDDNRHIRWFIMRNS